jgi:hypothetical protein
LETVQCDIFVAADVRLGSFASIFTCLRHVRLGGNPGNAGCPVCRSIWAGAVRSIRDEFETRPDGQINAVSLELPVQSPLQKYFPSSVGQITSTTRAVLSRKRGVAQRHQRGRGCDGRGRRGDECASQRTAKSCGPDAPTLASSFVGVTREATVTRKPGRRGDHEGTR